MFKLVGLLLIVLSLVVSFSSNSHGAGFALIEQGVSGLGNAYAGGAAQAEDATTMFYNPAGLTRLQKPQFIAAGHVIIPNAKFHNEGSTHVLQQVTGIPLRGGNGGDGGVIVFVPNLYFSYPFTEKFHFGLGINAPFGLQTEYEKDWVGRYHAIKSRVMTVNVNPTIAYKFTDNLSIGAGLSIQYIEAELTNAVDFGTIGVLRGIPGLLPQMNDGFARLKGDGLSGGFNVGALYEFTKDTRFGVSYRSKIRHKITGKARFSDVPATLSTVFTDSDASARLVLPDSASFSLYHSFNERFSVMADVTWTGWKSFDELRIKYESGMQDTVTSTKWKNSMRYSIGFSYKPIDKLTLKLGFAYDETPVPDKYHRTPRIPDTDRTWIALGAAYKVEERITLDFGYAHLFFKTSYVDKNIAPEDNIRGGLKGYFKGHVDIASLQFTYRF